MMEKEPVEWFENELYHHGILNQKWGVRRYQNKDGSLTEEGKLRYSKSQDRKEKWMNARSKIRQGVDKLKESSANRKAAKEEASKQALIRSGDRAKIYKNRRKFTNEELDELNTRFQKEDVLRRNAGLGDYSQASQKKKISMPSLIKTTSDVVDHVILGHNTLMKMGVMTDVIFGGMNPNDSRYTKRTVDYVKRKGGDKKK